MRQTRNKIVDLCLKTEGDIRGLLNSHMFSQRNPSLSFIEESIAKDLISDLKRLKKYIKSSGDYALGTRLASTLSDLTENFLFSLVPNTPPDRASLYEQMAHLESPSTQYLMQISDIESDLRNWLTVEERYRNASKSKLLAPELTEGTTKSRYVCRTSENKLRKIFSSLYEQGYVNPKTTINDWLYVCGCRNSHSNTIDWIKGQNELVYFIGRLFAEENENDVWSITSRLFTIKGKMQNPDTLRVVNCKASIKKVKKDKIDEILKIR